LRCIQTWVKLNGEIKAEELRRDSKRRTFGLDASSIRQHLEGFLMQLPTDLANKPTFYVIRRIIVHLSLCAALTASVTVSANDLVTRAQEIHDRVITLDTHVDISADNFTAQTNYLTAPDTQVDIPRMEAGGLDAAFFIVYVGQGPLTDEGYASAYESAVEKFDAIHWLTQELAPERIGLALTPRDVREIASSGRKVALIGVENAYPVGLDIKNISRFAERGARYMSLAHNGHSQFSDSNTGEIREGGMRYGGLSELGRRAVVEMNRSGIMIDLSHPSKEATMQTMALSRAPVIASHSSARGLEDNPRNMDDEQLLALKANGGVIQTVAFRSYLNGKKHTAWRSEYDALMRKVGAEMDIEIVADRRQVFMMNADDRAEYLNSIKPVLTRMGAMKNAVSAPPVDVADFVNHIDYLVAKIGIDHVGISSDFDGGGGVEGWNDADETFNVTLELVKRGYSEAEIDKLWSGNLLRVMGQVQAVAKLIQNADSRPQ
jgi:microsomal dipeptidase-like Zn-dependent dipeptidase